MRTLRSALAGGPSNTEKSFDSNNTWTDPWFWQSSHGNCWIALFSQARGLRGTAWVSVRASWVAPREEQAISRTQTVKRKTWKVEKFLGILSLLEQKANSVNNILAAFLGMQVGIEDNTLRRHKKQASVRVQARDTWMLQLMNGNKTLVAYLHLWPVFQEKCPCV